MSDNPAPNQSAASPASPAPSTPSTSPTTPSSATPATTAPDGRESTVLGTDAQPVEPEAPAATGFDTAKLTWPEGYDKPNEELLGRFAEAAKSQNLTQEGAQQLANLYVDAQKAASEANLQAWKSTLDTWESEINADQTVKDFKLGDQRGLDALKTGLARVLADPRFAVPGVREALNLTGAGSNPAFVRFMAKVIGALTEGGAVAGNGPAPTNRPRSAAQALYPNLPSETG